TITFGAWEGERAVYEAQIAAFEKDNPEIHVQFVPLDSILQTVDDTRTAIGQIMSAADTAAVPMSPGAIKQGAVRDLTPLIEADASFDRADFYPGALEAVAKDGGIAMLPRTLHI